MPFSPLPCPFLDEAGALALRPHVAVELGCGAGDFGAVLASTGLKVLGLDTGRPLPPDRPAVLGDALRPPLLPGSCDLLIAANLVRHLAPRRPELDFLAAWIGLLRPGGALYVFEDEPRGGPGPAGNYGRLQTLLAKVAPDGRGPLLGRDVFVQKATALQLTVADSGTWTNTWPLDARAVLTMLASGRPEPGGDVARLMRAIGRDGIACGPAWWARLQREDR